MSERDTAELVAKAQANDRSAVEQLLVRNLPNLEAFVRLRMGPVLRGLMTAPDLVQSVCREALEDLSGFEFRGEAPFRHWLFVRAENKLREKHRYHHAGKRDHQKQLPLPDATTAITGYQALVTPSKDVEVRESMRRIEVAFDLLPEDYREAITLHRLCGLSHAEIARRMGRTEGAIRNLVYRGISRMALMVDGGDADG